MKKLKEMDMDLWELMNAGIDPYEAEIKDKVDIYAEIAKHHPEVAPSDMELLPQPCKCDFETVILPYGCQCGGD